MFGYTVIYYLYYISTFSTVLLYEYSRAWKDDGILIDALCRPTVLRYEFHSRTYGARAAYYRCWWTT
jgi:hypothetical protein